LLLRFAPIELRWDRHRRNRSADGVQHVLRAGFGGGKGARAILEFTVVPLTTKGDWWRGSSVRTHLKVHATRIWRG
jgi:hypothetical protein